MIDCAEPGVNQTPGNSILRFVPVAHVYSAPEIPQIVMLK